MAVELVPIDQLDATAVAQNQAVITALMQEAFPNVELRRGVFHDLIHHLSAAIVTSEEDTIQDEKRSHSLLAISRDPSLADDDMVNQVFSNYRVDRKQGSQARGEITIVLNQLAATTIPLGAQFEADGKLFTSDLAYAARIVESAVLSDDDRVIRQIGPNQFAFSIDVTAVEEGPESQLKQNTKVVPLTPPLFFDTAFAASDFTGGISTETNEEILARFQLGLAAKAYSNRVNVEALIKEQEEFDDILQVSQIGFGDPEMVRDAHWIWPASGGGRVDVYSRNQRLPQNKRLVKTATLISTATDNVIGFPNLCKLGLGDGSEKLSVWQFTLNREDLPGFYRPIRILPESIESEFDPNSNGLEIISDERGFDLTAVESGALIPDIVNSIEAAYTRYSTAVIQFFDTETDVSGLSLGDTADYAVTVEGMPLVAELQDFLALRGVRNPAGDILVKAPVPCFTSLSFDVRKNESQEAPDLVAIKLALAEYVNTLGFCGQLHASALSDIIHDFLPPGCTALSAIDMLGRILRPDQTFELIRDKEIIFIPDEPERFVTGRTTMFILDTEDIAISVINADFPIV